MPANTPNFAFPYAVPGDPADVPTRMQALAEAIENQLENQETRSRARGMAQFLGTVPNTVPGVSTLGPFTWQTTDFNTPVDYLGNATTAVQPVTDPATTALRVNVPGFWLLFGSVQIPSLPGANVDELGIEFLINGSFTPQRCRSSTHETATAGDPTHLLDASAGVLLNAGDTVTLRGLVRRSSGQAFVTFGRRSITLLRMTLS